MTAVGVAFKGNGGIFQFSLSCSLEIETRRGRWIDADIGKGILGPAQGRGVKCLEAPLFEGKGDGRNLGGIVSSHFFESADREHSMEQGEEELSES